MAISTIGLRIAGTKQRQAGFAPLVNVGVLAGGEGDNMDRVTMISEKPSYVIKHAPDYILYQLIDRQVKSFDADAPGVLSIALTIPSNMQLANDVSPYKLLREVYEKFLVTYMERLSDGRDSFIKIDNDSEIFREILSKYPLEERKSSYITMNSQGMTGIVCVSLDDIEDFFCNTQYKEFAVFKDIEIGVNCPGMVSVGLDKLQIPLPPAVYEVWVNGRRTGETMQYPLDSYSSRVPNTQYHEYENVEFTLEDLFRAPNNRMLKNHANISLDFSSNRVLCDLKKTEIAYELVYEWNDIVGNAQKAIEDNIRKGIVKLFLNGRDMSNTIFNRYAISAVNADGLKIHITPVSVDSYVLRADSQLDKVNRKIIITITISPKQISPVKHIERNISSGHIASTANVSSPNNSSTYIKGATQGDMRPQTKKKKIFDLKSFILGLITGLLIGLAIVFLYTQIGAKTNKQQREQEQSAADTINNVAMETTNLPEETTPNIDVEAGGNEAVAIEKEEKELKKKQEEELVLREREAKAAEEKAAKQKKKDEIREQILALVNKKEDISKIRAIWDNEKDALTPREKNAVEAVLKHYTGQDKKKLDNAKIDLKNRKFNSLDDVVDTSNKITNVLKSE